jgi:hypothetical protein
MDWTLAPVVALMVFTVNAEAEIVDGVWYENKPYVTCMLKADSMRARRIDPYKVPACIRIDEAHNFMERKNGQRLHETRVSRPKNGDLHGPSPTRGEPQRD